MADYLERERPDDVDEVSDALMLSASLIGSRRQGGWLSTRSINTSLERIGRFHDGEYADEARHVSPLRPHDCGTRSRSSWPEPPIRTPTSSNGGSDIGRSYIARYTNPPEAVAAGGYIETM